MPTRTKSPKRAPKPWRGWQWNADIKAAYGTHCHKDMLPVTVIPDGAPTPLPRAVARLVKQALRLVERSTLTGSGHISNGTWVREDFVEAVDSYLRSINTKRAKGRK